jgi:hypothetical protein
LQFIQTNWPLLWAILFYAIYYVKGIEWKWEKKREIVAVTLLILTILILPFHLWGTYNINGLSNQGMHVGSSDSFDLAPEETYKSLALSNLYSESYGYLVLSAVGGNCTVYICDENNPESYANFTEYAQPQTYTEINFTDSEYIHIPLQFHLPYHYSELNVVAIWTLNFYNPSQTEQISVTFHIQGSPLMIDPPPPGPLLKYYQPTAVLVGLWFGAVFATLLSHVVRKRNQRTAISEKEDNLEAQDSKPRDEL